MMKFYLMTNQKEDEAKGCFKQLLRISKNNIRENIRNY